MGLLSPLIRRVKFPLFETKVTGVKPMTAPIGLSLFLKLKSCHCALCDKFCYDKKIVININLEIKVNQEFTGEEGTYTLCKECFDSVAIERDKIKVEDAPLYINSDNIFLKAYSVNLLKYYRKK